MKNKKQPVFILCLLAALLCMNAGCGCEEGEPIIFQTEERDGYQVILYEDREYVPYCPLSSQARGSYMGYIEDDENNKIYEWEGCSPEEWLINYLDSGLMNDTLLYKEANVTEIPEGISSEYEWNQ